MKRIATLLLAWLVGALPMCGQTNSLPTPVPNLKLTRGNANGNGLSFTNLAAMAAGTGSFAALTFGGQTRTDWPAVPVQSVNGETGAVVIQIPFMLDGSNIVWQRSGTNWTPQIVGTLPVGVIPALPYDASGVAVAQMQNLSNTVFNFGFLTGSSITNFATLPQLLAVSNAIPNVSAFITGAAASNSFDAIGIAAILAGNLSNSVFNAGFLTALSNINANTLGGQSAAYFASSNWVGSTFLTQAGFSSNAIIALIGQPLYAEQVNGVFLTIADWTGWSNANQALIAGAAQLSAANAFATNQFMPSLTLTNSYSNYWTALILNGTNIIATGYTDAQTVTFEHSMHGVLRTGQVFQVDGQVNSVDQITGAGLVVDVVSAWTGDFLDQQVYTQAVAVISPTIIFPNGTQPAPFSNTADQITGLLGYTPAVSGSITQGIVTLLGGTPNVTINTNGTERTISVADTPVPVQSVNGATGSVSFTIVNSFNGQTGAVSFAPSLVNSFNGQTGSVLQPIVTSFNGQTGAVVQPIVTSVNGQTGAVLTVTGFTNYGVNIIPLSGSTVLLDFAVAETNYAFSLGLNAAQTTLILTNLPTTSRLVPMRITATCGITGTIVLPPFLYFAGTVAPSTNYLAGTNYIWSLEAIFSNRVEGIFAPVQP